MDLDDRLELVAPEGISVDVVVAGLGSRAAAALFDYLLIGLGFGAAALAAGLVSTASPGLAQALLAVGGFMALLGYFVLFEAFGSGRTPGKRLTGTQVVTQGGDPASFWRIVIRNVLRAIDLLPTGYLVGMISILVSSRHQRVGDLVAGTLVVRVRTADDPASHNRVPAHASPAQWAMVAATAPPGLPPQVATWDLSQVTPSDVAAVRSFLDRRWTLPPPARAALANEFATRLAPKVVGPPTTEGPERFLEWVVYVKQVRG